MSEHGLDALLTVDQAIAILDSVPIVAAAIRARTPVSQSPAILAQDVFADRDYPPFDKSLMDGFAVRSVDLPGAQTTLRQVGEIAAGGSASVSIPPGACVAIMTGAPVPADADTVVPVEDTTTDADQICIRRAPKPGQAIAKRGSDLRAGTRVLAAGTAIGPAQVGALVQVGAFASIPSAVFSCESTLNAHVLVTGDEIVDENVTPGEREMRDVNGPMLQAWLASMSVSASRSRVIDDFAATSEAIDRLAKSHDCLLVTGGMSMGKYDYVPRALVELGFDLKITKLRIKPGKPFVFATRARADKTDFVFGLPGNPVSGFCCSVRLASRLIRRLQGRLPDEALASATLDSPLPANGPREFYQPAIATASIAHPLGWKGSADVFTLANANALIIRPADDPARNAGEKVSIVSW